MIPGGDMELQQTLIISEVVVTFIAVFKKIVEYLFKNNSNLV